MTRSLASGGAEEAATVAPPDFLDGFISEEEYAARRGVSVRTCQRDRQLHHSPPFVVVGRRVYYRIAAVRDWLLAREQRALGQAECPRSGRGR